MRRIGIGLTAVLLAAAPAVAGPVADLYQSDGEDGQDASDQCAGADTALELGGEVEFGQLFPGIDAQDHWGLTVPSGAVGDDITLTFHAEELVAPGEPASYRLRVQVLPPGDCITPILTESVEGGDTEQIVFTAEESGDYVIRVVFLTVTLVGTPTSLPVQDHCFPGCADVNYHHRAETTL